MGHQKKSLHFISALNCYHQTDFIANILHNWCPNLETLQLDGIQCFPSLLYMFEGRQAQFRTFNDTSINCEKLKKLTIIVECDVAYTNCRRREDQIPISVYNNNLRILDNILSDFKDTIELLPEKDLSELGDLFYQLIDLGHPYYFTNIAENYYPGLEGTDFGLLGNMLNKAPLKKLVIKKLSGLRQSQELLMSLMIFNAKFGTTLEQLEFHDAPLDDFCLRSLNLLTCPLSNIRLDKIDSRVNIKELHCAIQSFAETITCLEIGLDNDIDNEENELDEKAVGQIDNPTFIQSNMNRFIMNVNVDEST